MAMNLIGEVRGFARTPLDADWHLCDGCTLPIAENQPLFSLLGWRFGGDGWTTFAIPTLRWRLESRRGLTYGIAMDGLYPTIEGRMLETDQVGEIRLFAGQHAPVGWLPCDGRELPIEPPYLELYAMIGNEFGGGAASFALPNLVADAESVGELSYIVAFSPPSAEVNATTTTEDIP